MAKAIASNEISGKYLQFEPDVIWDAQALPNATTGESSEFKFGRAQGGNEIVIVANTVISIADTKILNFDLTHAETSGGTQTTLPIYEGAPSGGTLDFAAGDIIATYKAPDDIGEFCTLIATTSADESSEKVDAYLRYVSR